MEVSVVLLVLPHFERAVATLSRLVKVQNHHIEVFKVLEGVIDACCPRSPGPVWCEPESFEGVMFD